MEIRNSGLEVALDFQNGSQSGFYYNIGGNLTLLKNRVVDSPYAVLTTGAARGAGQTGATINGYINDEVIGTGDDGLNKFKDQNGDGQVIENDRIVVGTALPNVLYAFYTNFGYKNFDLSLNFNGVSGNKIYNHTAMSIFNKGNLASSFNTTDFAVQYPSEAITNSNEVSTRFLEDGSFLRMNNATLSYKLSPQKIGLDTWMNNIRFSVTG